MKSKIYLCSILAISAIFGQRFPDNELNVQVKDTPNSGIFFELSPVGTIFCNDTDCGFEEYTTVAFTVRLYTGGSGNILCGTNGFSIRYCNEGNYTDVINCAQPTAGLKPLRWGFYKMTIKVNGIVKGFCYFDWRDVGFPINICNTVCSDNDMTIRYDGNSNLMKFYNHGNPPLAELGTTIDDGEVITWAEKKDCTQRDFSPFWSEGLVLIPQDNHPRLIWGPYSSALSVIGYRVYRKYGGSPWDILVNNTGNVYEYTDTDVEITPPGGQAGTDVQYYVKGLYMPPYFLETDPTNTVTTNIVGEDIAKQSFISTHSPNEKYFLGQNYPNPFNPATSIQYFIEQNSTVVLTVYDIIGNKVAILVNEEKTAGVHQVEFDASYLPSGIYFYTLNAGTYFETKKMILLK